MGANLELARILNQPYLIPCNFRNTFIISILQAAPCIKFYMIASQIVLLHCDPVRGAINKSHGIVL